MKRTQKLPRREIFVLTPGEKQAVVLITAAFLLGLGTMHYRSRHPRPPLPPTAKEQREAKRAAARARSHRGSLKNTPTVPPKPEIAADDDE